MRRFLIFFIAAIITSTFIESCKRYEDGPDVSLRSAKKRLGGGWWNFYSYVVNGIDSTSYYRDSIKCSVQFYFDKDLGQEIEFDIVRNNMNYVNAGDFSLSNHKKELTIVMNYMLNYKGFEPFFQAEPVTWKILRLTKDELWISSVFNSSNYSIKMLKTDEPF